MFNSHSENFAVSCSGEEKRVVMSDTGTDIDYLILISMMETCFQGCSTTRSQKRQLVACNFRYLIIVIINYLRMMLMELQGCTG